MIEKYYNLFVCPEDRSNLFQDKNNLVCEKCNRIFPILEKNFVEILPAKITKRKPTCQLEEKNISQYKTMFEQKFEWRSDSFPWGYFHHLSLKHKSYVVKQLDMIKKILPDRLGIFCDISAGNGNYAFKLVKRADLLLLCDISVDNLNYLYRKINELKLQNSLLCRADYLRLPIRDNSLDTILCTDTLIYGKEHELLLLKNIHSSLKIGRIALVNFSNRMHQLSPFHKPYTIGYTKKQIKDMLIAVGITDYKIIPCYQELSKDFNETSIYAKIVKPIIPPTRYFVVFKK